MNHQLLRRITTVSLLGLAVAFAGCSDDSSTTDEGSAGGAPNNSAGGDAGGNEGGGDGMAQQTIVELAAANPDLSSLVAAVTKAGLVDALGGSDLTVFAPTNEAFAALLEAVGASSLDDLTAEQLRPILLYHVVGARVDAAAATAAAEAEERVATLGGQVALSLNGGALTLDGSAEVVTADVMASNGVVHVIDAVILPSITDVVTTDPELGSLAAAIGVADGDSSDPELAATLDGPGTFTLFAPGDDAFAATLEANSLADLPALVTAVGGSSGLISVLTYHVLSSRVLAADAVAADGTSVAPLLASSSITVDVIDGAVVLNDGVTPAGGFAGMNSAQVVVTDLVTANGVIHKVDAVLAP